MVLVPGILLTAVVSIVLFLALCAALVLVVIGMRRPATMSLVAAGVLVVLCLAVVAVAHAPIPPLMGVILTLLGLAVGVIGGNPVTRRVLDAAAGSRVRETIDGGIVVTARETVGGAEPPTLMRGGTVIGYVERFAVVLAVVLGFPEALAVVVAVKGIGRFAELAEAEARERFIIGTLASLSWACLVGALLRFGAW